MTPQQPSAQTEQAQTEQAQTEQAQTEQGQKAKPRFEYRIKRSNQAGEGESSAVLRKLDAVLQRIERLEATVKKLQK